MQARTSATYTRHDPLGDFFAACYVSGEPGLLKPYPEIYHHALDDLDISADEDETGLAGPEGPCVADERHAA